MTYTLTSWSLQDLFPGIESPELEQAFNQLETLVTEFEKSRNQLSSELSSNIFLSLIQQSEDIMRTGYRVYGFASLSFAANTQDQSAQTMMGRVQQFFAELQNRMLFFSLWWKDLDESNANRLMADSGDYRYYLEEMRHYKPHTLTEPEEQIINLKNVTGIEAITNLYDSLTNRYVFKLEVDGELREMTRGELMSYVRRPEPELRARAYQELYRVFSEDGQILGKMYEAVVRDWRNENVLLRKHANPIAARNLANDIPNDVIDTLLEVAHKNAPIFQRYFSIKARTLGIEKLQRYDIYAPISKAEKTYTFDEAAELVLQSFSQFDSKTGELARRVFDDNHLDSEVRKGKRSGAFCSTIGPDLTPWVLVNFQNRADDVATLAHELGHAIHSMLAEHHSLFTQHSCLPLAETASTFGEMMLLDKLLAQETDSSVRRDMLFRQIDDAYATIMRQAFFALFEKQAHEMIQNNASVDELSTAYMENLKTQFGNAVEVSDEFKWEWVSIPHIYHTPFYVYSYAFGQLLVFALYQQFKAEGESFKPRYLQILAAGGSESPENILSKAGIDMHSADFWQGGFNVISDLVEQLENL